PVISAGQPRSLQTVPDSVLCLGCTAQLAQNEKLTFVQIKLMLIERKIASQIRPASHNSLSPSHSDLTVQHHSLPVFCVPMYFWHGYLIVPYQFSELLILGD